MSMYIIKNIVNNEPYIFKNVLIKVTGFKPYAGKYNFIRPSRLLIFWSK